MSTNTGISPHATAFAQSYATATALATPGTASSLQSAAREMSSHYLPNLISFTLGTTTTISSAAEAEKGTLQHLQRLQKAGVGTEIKLVRMAVKEVGEFAATVFVTWEIKGGGWRWRNAYGYRRMPEADGKVKEGFEFIVSDEEVGELVKRVPSYFEL